jgi:hypothetical protein
MSKLKFLSTGDLLILKEKYIQERDNLIMLESIVEYHNNPDLNKQRNIVCRLRDKIFYEESYDEYLKFNKQECQFMRSEYCDIKINNTYRNWLQFGNCCKTCSLEMSNIPVRKEELLLTRKTAWDELAVLDNEDKDNEDIE